MQEETKIMFARNHASFVVGMIDIVHSTELMVILSGEKIDEFYTTFLEEISHILIRHGAWVIKNVGDGMLFYFPTTRDNLPESARSAIECGQALITGREEINAKLKNQGLSPISYRVSMSFGHVSAMLNNTGQIIDLFGATVSTCSKINKLAAPNTFIVGETFNEYLKLLDIPTQKIADYRASDIVTFGVFEVK